MRAMNRAMTLKEFCVPRGTAVWLADQIGASGAQISQWSNLTRAVPEEHAPAIEWHTDFAVTVEILCPDTRWIRVKDPAWPNGRPLIDKTPQAASMPAAMSETSQRA